VAVNVADKVVMRSAQATPPMMVAMYSSECVPNEEVRRRVVVNVNKQPIFSAAIERHGPINKRR
jgi:hypothetical protein